MREITLYRAAQDVEDVLGCWTPDEDYARNYLDAAAGGDPDYYGVGEVMLRLTIPLPRAAFLDGIGNDDRADWQIRITPRVPEGVDWIVYEDDAGGPGWWAVNEEGNGFPSDAPYTWVCVAGEFPRAAVRVVEIE